MNGSLEMAASFIPQLMDSLLEVTGWEKNVTIGICPPYPYLGVLASKCEGYPMWAGAQDVSSKLIGAYTGEVSATMLSDMALKFCLVGHSERRQYHKESDALINAKHA